MKHNFQTLSLLMSIMLTLSSLSLAAEYQGRNIDGEVFEATAYSYSTAKYYSVSVEFEGDEVIVHFQKGGRVRLTLDDEEIDDPHDISAYDYENSVYWDIDVDGLD